MPSGRVQRTTAGRAKAAFCPGRVTCTLISDEKEAGREVRMNMPPREMSVARPEKDSVDPFATHSTATSMGART